MVELTAFPLSDKVPRVRFRLLSTLLPFFTFCCSALTEEERDERTERDVVVNAESDEGEHNEFTEMGESGQPAWAERSRASSTTSAYVLSPYEAFFGLEWETDFNRHGKTTHDFVQELDVGFPHRFELGVENDVGLFGSDAHNTSLTFETRYALADWDKIPLNPALSFEYVLGTGSNVQSERLRDRNGDRHLQRQPDGVIGRILLARGFADNRIAYAMNISLQQDVADDHSGREFQLSQSAAYSMCKGAVELGAEMRYTHDTSETIYGTRDELEIGPTFSWKPTRQTRLSISPLFGCNHDTPVVATFALFSYEFGGAEAVMPPAGAGGH